MNSHLQCCPTKLNKCNCLDRLCRLSYSQIHHSNKQNTLLWQRRAAVFARKMGLVDVFAGFGLQSLVELVGGFLADGSATDWAQR